MDIRTARHAARMTQAQAAEKLGIARETYALWELSPEKITPPWRLYIERIFGVKEGGIDFTKQVKLNSRVKLKNKCKKKR